MNPLFPPGADRPHFLDRYQMEGLRFETVRYPSGLQVPLHAHEEVFLDLCVSGSIGERWKDARFVRGPLTLNYLPQGALHGNCYREDVETFQVVLSGKWLERMPHGRAPGGGPICYESCLPNWTAARLYREFQHRDDLTPLVLEGILLELLAQLFRETGKPANKEAPRWLREARDYLHDHFTDTIAVDDLASAVGIHPAHLMRAFRQQQGCTVGDYVRRLRVEYASHLLAQSEMSLTHIAVETGFAGQSHFHRTFKALTGLAPSEFRRAAVRSSGKP